MTHKRFFVRKWLNRPGFYSTAAIAGEVTLSKDPEWPSVAADLEVLDCSRKVTLEFSTSVHLSNGRRPTKRDYAEIANVQFKANLLRKTVNDFCDSLDEALAEFLHQIDGTETP